MVSTPLAISASTIAMPPVIGPALVLVLVRALVSRRIQPPALLRHPATTAATDNGTLCSSCPQPQQSIGVAMRHLGEIRRRERQRAQEVATTDVGGIGVVDREHHPVDAERQQ